MSLDIQTIDDSKPRDRALSLYSVRLLGLILCQAIFQEEQIKMAKRAAAAAKEGVVISQEILAIVQSNKGIRGPEVMVALREKFPKVEFNEASCQVAYANARKKLGLTRTVAKRPARSTSRPAAKASAATAPAAVGAAVDINLLQAAKTLLQQCNGDSAAAILALKHVASLQMV